MDIRIMQLKLIKAILEITSSDILEELYKSFGEILLQDKMESQSEAIRLLEAEDEIPEEIVEEDEYRKKLIDAVQNLSDCKNEIFTSLINVAMLGEFKDIHEAFEVGDIYEFEIEQFKDSKDINVEKMVLLYEFMSETMESIMNINAIENPEDND